MKGQFFAAAQYQIILGTGFVDKVYDAFIAGTDLAAAAASGKQEAYKQMTPLQKVSRTLGDVFVPVIPVLVATGLFMGLRGMAQSLGIGMNENLIRMSQILTDTAFAFLPALVCWSTMNRFGGTPVIGIVLGLMLVAPQLPNAYAIAAGDAVPLSMEIFGIPIPVVGYQGSVLPALVLGIFAARLQKWFKTFVPDIVDLIVTPFLTLLVSMLLGLLVIGPIMHTLEIVIFGAVRTFLELPYGIGGFVVGGLHQVIVVFGVHHVFNALEVQLLASTGVDPFNAIITGAIVAQGGAAVAVAARTHNAKKRALPLPCPPSSASRSRRFSASICASCAPLSADLPGGPVRVPPRGSCTLRERAWALRCCRACCSTLTISPLTSLSISSALLSHSV